MASEQRLRQISELCAGQAADRRKSVAEIMAEHIWVKEAEIARIAAERDAALARAERAEAERDAVLMFLCEAESIDSVRDPAYQEQFIERHHAWLARAVAVKRDAVGWYDSRGEWHPAVERVYEQAREQMRERTEDRDDGRAAH